MFQQKLFGMEEARKDARHGKFTSNWERSFRVTKDLKMEHIGLKS